MMKVSSISAGVNGIWIMESGGGDDFGEGPDHGGDDLEGRGSGGDVQIGEDTWTFTPKDPETGEPLGPTEAYEVGEEGKIEGDRRDDDDDDAPVGPSG